MKRLVENDEKLLAARYLAFSCCDRRLWQTPKLADTSSVEFLVVSADERPLASLGDIWTHRQTV